MAKQFAKWALAAVLVCGSAHVVASGIPVVDIMGITQRIQQLEQLENQLSTAKSQLQSQADQLKAMTGSRGMGQLLNSSGLDQVLPKQADLSQMSNAQQQAYLQQIQQNGASKSASDYVTDRAQSASATAAMSDASYQATVDRVNTIQGLASHIDTATDPKAVADLQARIAIEQASIQNETNRLQLLAMRAKAQQDLQQAQQDEQAEGIFSPQNSSMPSLTN